MSKKYIKQTIIIGLITTLLFCPLSASAALLKKGSQNNEVKKVQSVLMQLGYFTYPKATGYYGGITLDAVKQFQRAYGLAADGIVGFQTSKLLFQNNQSDMLTSTVKQGYNGALDWYKEVQYILAKGVNATVTDIDSGISFQVKRTFGYNHADVESLTEEDSDIIQSIWNGWSWERRAVVVNVNGKLLAGSMTAMPHAGLDAYQPGVLVDNRSCNYGTGYNLDEIKNNGADGVMDIHFLNSRTHSTNKVLESQQNMVKKASQYIAEIGQ